MNLTGQGFLKRILGAFRPEAKTETAPVNKIKTRITRSRNKNIEDQFTAYFRTGGGCMRKRHL